MPAGPRCKLCEAPLRPPGSVVLRLVGFGPSRLNRRLCRACFRSVEKHPGGAEIELSFLFADVRGSTSLAERMPAQEFSRLISRFYGTAARVVDGWNGLVDKFVGDEVVALFIPGFGGENHAARPASRRARWPSAVVTRPSTPGSRSLSASAPSSAVTPEASPR